jgi:hypothetical protein
LVAGLKTKTGQKGRRKEKKRKEFYLFEITSNK